MLKPPIDQAAILGRNVARFLGRPR